MVQNIQEKENPGPSNYFKQLVSKVSYSNLYGFSPLWVKRCFLNTPAWLNDLSHCAHVCSFSPLWMRRCLLRFSAWLNVLSQSAQVYIFIPLCVIKCLFRCTDRLNVLLQSEQVFIYPTVRQQVRLQISSFTERFVEINVGTYCGMSIGAGELKAIGGSEICFHCCREISVGIW